MSRRHNAIFPENYATLLTRGVDVPFFAWGLKFWVRFYGIRSEDLTQEHFRIAMARRGLKPGQWQLATRAPMAEAAA